MRKVATVGVTLLAALTLTACGSSESPKSSASSESSTSSSKKVTKVKDELGLSTKQVKEYNTSLSDGLSEDQGYARKGDDGYKPSLFIESISYDSNRGLHVKIQPQFLELSNLDKDKVASYSQGMASTQLIIIGVDDKTDQKVPTNFYDGANRIGGSKFTSATSYKWK